MIVYTNLSGEITAIKMDVRSALEFIKYAHNIFASSKAKVFNSSSCFSIYLKMDIHSAL